MQKPVTTLAAHQEALRTLLREFDRVCRALDIPYFLFAGTLLGAVRHGDFIPWDDDVDVLMLRRDYDRFMEQAEQCLDRESFFLQKEFSPGWPMFFSKLRLNGTTCLEKYHPKDKDSHQGVYLDIFPCDNALDSGLGRKLQFAASKVVIAKSLYRRGYDTDSKKKKLFMFLCRLLPAKPFLLLARAGREDSAVLHSFFAAASGFSRNVYRRELFARRVELPFGPGLFYAPGEHDALLKILYGDYMRLPPPEERVTKEHAILVDLERPYTYYRDYRDGMVFEQYTKSIR